MSKEILPILDTPIFLLDYDGTLAPIRQDPMQAFPHKEVNPLLRRLMEAFPVWIITGRHLKDLQVLMDVQLPAVGLHGLQKGVIGDEVRATLSKSVQEDIRHMRRILPSIDETRVEDKEYTFAVHYRGAVHEEPIVASLETWLNKLPPSLVAIWGKKVVELKPAGISKGTAIEEILNEYPDNQPIYIGDDTTDEAAFAILNQLTSRDTVSVKVGEGPTSAKYRLPHVEAVVAYLKLYLNS